MKTAKTLLAATLFGASLSASAGITLGFDDIVQSDNEPKQVLNRYAADYGITFSSRAVAYRPIDAVGATGAQFSNAPSADSAIAIFDADRLMSSFSITVANGFKDSFSFFFAGIDPAPGTGVVLTGSFDDGSTEKVLTFNAVSGEACYSDAWSVDLACKWYEQTIAFSGTAFEVTFTAPVGNMFFDNLVFGAQPTGGNDIPEPGTLALLAVAAGAAALGRRRKLATAN